jgi:hypothetical protein
MCLIEGLRPDRARFVRRSKGEILAAFMEDKKLLFCAWH